MELKLETKIEFEDGSIPVRDDYEYISDLINAIRERASLMTPEQEYTFYKYCIDVLNDLEFVEEED